MTKRRIVLVVAFDKYEFQRYIQDIQGASCPSVPTRGTAIVRGVEYVYVSKPSKMSTFFDCEVITIGSGSRRSDYKYIKKRFPQVTSPMPPISLTKPE